MTNMSYASQSATFPHVALGSAIAGCAMVALVYPLNAQSAEQVGRPTKEPVIQEVIVTAQKREERLQDVPVPVSVLAADTLAQTEQVRLQEFYAKVPGLSLSAEGNGQQRIAVRGITTGGQTGATVGITVDDVAFGPNALLSLGSLLVPDLDPADLSRVEVLKGPQGTLYGASSIGGLLKFVTRDPSTSELSGQVQTSLSTVEQGHELGYGVRGSVNVPLSETFAMRASAFTRREPGFVENLETGQRGVNQLEVSGGRLSALYQPSDSVTLRLSALMQNSQADGGSRVDANYLLKPTLGDLDQRSLRGTEAFDIKARLYTASLTIDQPSFEFVSISAYNKTSYAQLGDASGAYGGLSELLFGVSGAAVGNDFSSKKFSQEFRLSSASAQTIEWLVGLFYTDEETPARQFIPAIDPATGGSVGLVLNSLFPTTYKESAAFGDLTFHFTDQFDIQLGARYSRNRQTYSETDTGPLVPLAFGVPEPFLVPLQRTKDDATTYLLTPRFKISRDLMVYARLASGYRTGGPNPAGVLFGFPEAYEPDKTLNYELGAKGHLFDGVLTFDASVFHIKWEKMQLELRDPVSGYGFLTNATEARSQGAELSLQTYPTEGLRLAATAAWTDAELTEDFPSESTAVGVDGDRLPFGARFSGSFSADQDIPLNAVWTGFLGGSLSYVGDREGDFATAADHVRVRLPSYTQVDLRLGIRSDDWTVSLFANNVSDERGIVGAAPERGGGTAADPFWVTYIRPRTLGLSVAKTF